MKNLTDIKKLQALALGGVCFFVAALILISQKAFSLAAIPITMFIINYIAICSVHRKIIQSDARLNKETHDQFATKRKEPSNSV